MKLTISHLIFTSALILASYDGKTREHRPLQPEKKKVAPIGHIVYGNGTQNVIVLHDWMGDSENWLPLLPYLSLKNFTYTFMDVRGYGKSKDIKGSYKSEEIAQDIFDLADYLGYNEFHLIGHSMTGMAVQKAASLDRDNRIVSVIAITPVSAKGFPLDDKNKQFFKSIINNRLVAEMGYNAMTGQRLTENWQKERAQRFLENVDPVACERYLEMWSNEDFSKQIAGLEKPFLVIAGQYDHPGFKLEAQKVNFESFKNVTFLENLNAGHYPMEETPIFLATAIEDFLNKHIH
ncbi:MAG: alpha/beta fold hydrolase [Cyclobacteriaceae bacterium]